MSSTCALVVDDEADIRELLELTLMRMGVDSVCVADLSEARHMLDTRSFDLCLTDMRLPDGDGIDLVRYISQCFPSLPTAVITAHGNMELAVLALKAGAFDFVSKPVDLPKLRNLVESALKLGTDEHPAKPQNGITLLGKSRAMEKIREMIAKLARSQAPVYISGESGTGKELVARAIHEQGARSDMPFIAVNCGAIPQELMESEFFGHQKGSFTGAIADKAGLFRAAEGGTLFLDEVADLPLSMQVKLLRAIQEKSIRPVGSETEETVDVRLLSATHKNLAQLVESGLFRQDLYYRINVIELPIPPLRKRTEDIPVLCGHILGILAEQTELPPCRLAPDALKALLTHPLPGNVRELENLLERANTLCDGHVICSEDLNLPAPTTQQKEESAGQPLEDYLGDVEKGAILKALEETKWNRTAAARKLGITLRALRYRLDKLGLNDNQAD